jgi:hypothetical protein
MYEWFLGGYSHKCRKPDIVFTHKSIKWFCIFKDYIYSALNFCAHNSALVTMLLMFQFDAP